MDMIQSENKHTQLSMLMLLQSNNMIPNQVSTARDNFQLNQNLSFIVHINFTTDSKMKAQMLKSPIIQAQGLPRDLRL